MQRLPSAADQPERGAERSWLEVSGEWQLHAWHRQANGGQGSRMRNAAFLMMVQVLVVATLTSLPAAAATFQVAEEEEGPECWLDFSLSRNQTLAIFSGKGNGGERVDLLLEDKQEDGGFSKIAETFDVSFRFGDGTRQTYTGSISEYFGEPYAEADLKLLKKLSDGKAFDLVVTGIEPIHVTDTLPRAAYSQFMKCVSHR